MPTDETALPPLDAIGRARVVAVLEAHAPEYAARVAAQLDGGTALARAVTELGDTLRSEQRETRDVIRAEMESQRKQNGRVMSGVMVVVLVGMAINAAMVGVGISYGLGNQTITVTPAGTVDVPVSIPGAPVPIPPIPVPLFAPVPEADVDLDPVAEGGDTAPSAADRSVP